MSRLLIISLVGWLMMARMLSQILLPLLPAGAAEIAPGVGLLGGEESIYQDQQE